MQILAGSLNVEVGQFLHAGYLSANPRAFREQGFVVLANSKPKLIDVKKAVELKEPTDQATIATIAQVESPALPSATMWSETCAFTVAIFFFSYLIISCYRRVGNSGKPRWSPWVFAPVPILFVAMIQLWAWPAYEDYALTNLPRPWDNVPIKEYRDPHAATEVILHALVANALLGNAEDVRSLAGIQKEVAFPVVAAEYSPGMTYSQATYGRDGWGRDFSFERLGYGQYRITSAGPDGIPGTKDDIAFVAPEITGSWEKNLGGVYCRVSESQEVVLIHHIDSRLFLSAHLETARQLTGTDLFDSFRLDELRSIRWDPKKGKWPIVAKLESRRKLDSNKRKVDELLFVRFEGKTNE